MFWRKKPKKLELSATKQYLADNPAINFDNMSQFGPALPVLNLPPQAPATQDLERYWLPMGVHAWRILRKIRMREVFRDNSVSEFKRYRELIERSPAPYHEEVFIGLDYRSNRPMFVPRFVFERHGYILGASGSGKTTHGLAQVLLQLAQDYTDSRGEHHDPPPILIIDLKQNGDRYLRALAQRLASKRKQELQFFSNDPDYESLLFDPLHCLRGVKYPIKLLETLLKAFSMIYPEGYGSDFFTNEQRVQLMEILYNERPDTMNQLIRFIRAATRGKSGNTDARGLYSALAALQHAMHVHTDGSPIPEEQRIDFERFFEQREILYVHLDSRSMTLLSRDIGKLMLFSMLETASQREKQGQKVQAFVAIDEFHRLAARNIVEMLEDARGAGIGFLIAHQSSSSLVTRDADLYGTLFENCSFKQCLTLEDERVISRFQLIAGRSREIRRGGSTSKSRTTSGHKDATDQHSRTDSYSEFTGAWSHSEGRSWGDTTGAGESRSTEEAESWQEEMIPGLTPEMITCVNDNELVSLVHVKGTGGQSLTPTGGIPVVIQGLFPFLPDEARVMGEEPWPLKPNLSTEAYYRSARPKLPLDELEHPRRPVQSTGHEVVPDETVPSPTLEQPWNEGEERELKSRIRRLAERLAHHMIEESLSVQRLARMEGLSVNEVIELAKRSGIELLDKDTMLTPEQVALVLRTRAGEKPDEAP